MKKLYIIGFLVLLVFDTFTQTSFKLAALGASPAVLSLDWILRLLSQHWLYLAVLSYIGAFITYMTVLEHAPLGPAFAATHLEIVATLVVAAIFLGEHMTWIQMAGGLLIMSGVACLALEREEPAIAPAVEKRHVEHVA